DPHTSQLTQACCLSNGNLLVVAMDLNSSLRVGDDPATFQRSTTNRMICRASQPTADGRAQCRLSDYGFLTRFEVLFEEFFPFMPGNGASDDMFVLLRLVCH